MRILSELVTLCHEVQSRVISADCSNDGLHLAVRTCCIVLSVFRRLQTTIQKIQTCAEWNCAKNKFLKPLLLSRQKTIHHLFLISNFRRAVNVVCFLLSNSPAPEFCMPTFRNTLFHLHRRVGMKNTTYNIQHISLTLYATIKSLGLLQNHLLQKDPTA
jgi:hypothetical protein